MVDKTMPEPENEFISGTRQAYPKGIAAHVKDFANKIRLVHTLQGLESLKRDITRSDIAAHAQAKEELRAGANTRAQELGFKPMHRGDLWWQ